MRRIGVVTGTRAEYGLLKPVMEAIREHPLLELQTIVAGMHLDKQFGLTYREIEQDGFNVDKKVFMPIDDDSSYAMSSSIGKGVTEFSSCYEELRPDFVLILGDRTEALAAVIAASYMRIPVAHIHGGDVSKGGLDESARHAITKFANIHFPATELSAERIRMLGEDDWRIQVVGAPGLDPILHEEIISKSQLEDKLGFKLQHPTILVLQHSVTTMPDKAADQMKETLRAALALGKKIIVVYPNSDAGGRAIVEVIEQHNNQSDKIHLFKSLEHSIFLSLLKHVDVMVGNSSCAIIETSSFGLPVVNIGIRQDGRERAQNVIDVDHDYNEITTAIQKAFSPDFKKTLQNCVNPYGGGNAGVKIADTLSKVETNLDLLQKQLSYDLPISSKKKPNAKKPRRILVIAPHPDDEVLGCGGTIARRVKEGHEIHLCVVTKAYLPEWSRESIKERKEEVYRVAESLGIRKVFFLDYPTAKLDTVPQKELNSAIKKVVNEVEPDEVYLPHKGDLNRDHRSVFESALVAMRPMQSSVKKILAYETLSETEWGRHLDTFVPLVFVDITDTIDKKLEVMKLYKQEIRQLPHPRSLEIVKALARKRGSESGVHFAEAFSPVREIK